MVLTIALIVIVGGGAGAAWAMGRTLSPGIPADYATGPSASTQVQISEAARRHPRSAEVQETLQAYFDAINDRDFDGWVAAVAPDQSARQTGDLWREAYSTTVDSNVMVASVDDGPLRARVMFTSEQDVAYAPKRLPSTCINWDLTYLLADQDGTLVLSGIDPSAQSMTPCQ